MSTHKIYGSVLQVLLLNVSYFIESNIQAKTLTNRSCSYPKLTLMIAYIINDSTIGQRLILVQVLNLKLLKLL